jgi:hypothetical protein
MNGKIIHVPNHQAMVIEIVDLPISRKHGVIDPSFLGTVYQRVTHVPTSSGFNPSENDGVKVSWDDEIPFPTEWKVIKIHGSKPPTRTSLLMDNPLLTIIRYY